MGKPPQERAERMYSLSGSGFKLILVTSNEDKTCRLRTLMGGSMVIKRKEVGLWLCVVAVFGWVGYLSHKVYARTQVSDPTHLSNVRPKGVELNPISTKCFSHAWPERMGYRRVTEDRRAEIAFRAQTEKFRTLSAPTLWCIDLGSCDNQPAGCKHVTAIFTEDWYEQPKLPTRRVK